jgi:hypothetical protein
MIYRTIILIFLAAIFASCDSQQQNNLPLCAGSQIADARARNRSNSILQQMRYEFPGIEMELANSNPLGLVMVMSPDQKLGIEQRTKITQRWESLIQTNQIEPGRCPMEVWETRK